MMMENLNKEGLLNKNALNDDDLEQVTGGRNNRKIDDKEGKTKRAKAGYHAAAEAEADVKGYAEATSRIWAARE